jgi:hypothetical protein
MRWTDGVSRSRRLRLYLTPCKSLLDWKAHHSQAAGGRSAAKERMDWQRFTHVSSTESSGAQNQLWGTAASNQNHLSRKPAPTARCLTSLLLCSILCSIQRWIARIEQESTTYGCGFRKQDTGQSVHDEMVVSSPIRTALRLCPRCSL